MFLIFLPFFVFVHFLRCCRFSGFSVESRPAVAIVRMRIRSTHAWSEVIEGGARKAPLPCSFSKNFDVYTIFAIFHHFHLFFAIVSLSFNCFLCFLEIPWLILFGIFGIFSFCFFADS